MSVTDYTVDGHCSGCGECCSNFLPLSKGDVKKIHRYLTKHPQKEQRHNVIAGGDATCPFRDSVNRKCLIYEVRPTICRVFQCNHTIADIERNKQVFQARCDLVDMRYEFFGNDECQDAMKLIPLTLREYERRNIT